MVRKQEEKKQGIETLETLEQETESEIKKINDIRKKEFGNEMDSAFYFSVVFDTRAERDQWLKERKLTLEEDFFIRANKFLI